MISEKLCDHDSLLLPRHLKARTCVTIGSFGAMGPKPLALYFCLVPISNLDSCFFFSQIQQPLCI